MLKILPLNNVNNKWPAIIFAVNRIDKVNGRIIFLNNSINTIKNIKIKGVPLGTKWININFIFLIHPNIINPNHIGIDKVKENNKCLELVKIYGNNPKKLLNIININIIK